MGVPITLLSATFPSKYELFFDSLFGTKFNVIRSPSSIRTNVRMVKQQVDSKVNMQILALTTISAWAADCVFQDKLMMVVCKTRAIAEHVYEKTKAVSSILRTEDMKDLEEQPRRDYIDGLMRSWNREKPVLVGTSGLITGYDNPRVYVVLAVGAMFSLIDMVQFAGRPGRTVEYTQENPALAIFLFTEDDLKVVPKDSSTDGRQVLLLKEDREAVKNILQSSRCLSYDISAFFDNVQVTCNTNYMAKCSNCIGAQLLPPTNLDFFSQDDDVQVMM
jgi:superfamily II DNA helicase RecQ